MTYRFIRESDYIDGLYIVSGKGLIKTEVYSRVKITISSLEGKKLITITKLKYIPDFITNLISESQRENRNLREIANCAL